MTASDRYNFTRYLASKTTVDDRALNRHVWDAFARELTVRQAVDDHRLNVLEVGAGSGTMIERCLELDLLRRCEYTAIDTDKGNIEAALANLPKRAGLLGFMSSNKEGDDDFSAVDERYQLHFVRKEHDAASVTTTRIDSERVDSVQITLEAADMFEYAARPEQKERYDLLIAHAFLDLVNVPRALVQLRGMLRQNALLYLTINFDGATILQPELDPDFDALVEGLYHETMDQRIVAGQPSGDSHTGRHMFGHLRASGMDIIAAGSSDWVVYAGPDGYVEDEAYFLHFIVDTMHGALKDHPLLDTQRFTHWINKRHEQIDHRELVYIAHQLDFLARLRAKS